MMVDATSSNGNVMVYASQFSAGEGGIVLVNKSIQGLIAELNLKNFKPGTRYYTYTLTGGTDNGDFSRKVLVNGVTTSADGGGPENFETIKPKSTLISGNIKLFIPKYSVTHLIVESKH